jgi:ATP-dependent protease ClpP protease subunit
MFKLQKLTDKAVLTIYGYVGGAYLDFRAVRAALDDITNSGFKKLDFHFHTYGGDVFEGNLIYNFLAGFDGELNIIIDGIAASMGSVIMSAGINKPDIVKNGFIMLHVPKGGGYGSAKDFVAQAKLLRNIEKNFKSDLMELTGKSESEISKYFDGSDHWFSAEEALKLGLVGKIIDPKVKNITTLDKSEVSTIGAKAAFDRYAASLVALVEKPKTSEMNKEYLIKRYQLTSVTAESTDEQVLAAVDAKIAEGKKAQEDAKAVLKKSIEAAVDKAIEDKKITKEQRDNYIARGEKLGIEELNAIFSDIKPYKPVAESLGGKGGKKTVEAERKDWSFDDYQKKDPAALEAMVKEDPDTFKALYKAKYEIEPEI